MTKLFEKTELVELVPEELKEKLNHSQQLIIGQLISLTGIEQYKQNGYVFLSNQEFCGLIGITEKTLIRNLIALQSMGLIERKVGVRNSEGAKASEYKLNLNTVNCDKSFTVNYSDSYSDNYSKDYSKEIIELITEYQHFMNKALGLLLYLQNENYSKDYSDNYSTESDTESEVKERTKEINKEKRKKRSNKDLCCKGLNLEDSNEISNEISPTSTDTITEYGNKSDDGFCFIEKAIIPKADYSIPYNVQEHKYKTMAARLKDIDNIDELNFKYTLLMNYLNSNRYALQFIESARHLKEEMENKLQQVQIENPESIIIPPPAPASEICALNASNDADGITTHQQEENPSEEEKRALQQKCYEMLRNVISEIVSVADLKEANKSLNEHKKDVSNEQLDKLQKLIMEKCNEL